MDGIRSHELARAAAWAVATALLAQASLPAAAALACIGLCYGGGPGRAALPVLLAVLPDLVASVHDASSNALEATATAEACGPVRVRGRVVDVVHAPLLQRSYVTLAPDLRLACDGGFPALPGDRLEVLARRGARAAPGQRPTLQALPATAQIEVAPWSWRRGCAALRRAFEQELLRLVPGEHGAMLATLVLGRATRPDPELAEAHRATGLSHLLAVSGAHAAMLALLLGLSSRGRHLGASRARTTFVLGVLLVYGSIAGAEPPVLRAVVAFTLAAIAARTGRPFGIVTGLLAPALVTCMLQPKALLGPSFLLSYAAVGGLALSLRGRRDTGVRAWFAEAVRASWWATTCTAPLTLWFFDQLAPWTILLTPLLAPLVAMMLLFGLLAALLGLVAQPLAEPLGLLLQLLASCYAGLVHAADHLPGTPLPALQRPPHALLVLVAGGGAAWLTARPSRHRLQIVIWSLVLCWFVPIAPTATDRIVLLPVGHGQAALLQRGGRQVLIDCGSLHGGFRAARRVDEALRRRCIDLLVVTHADQDHHNGIPFLLGRVHIAQALLAYDLADSALADELRQRGIPTRLAAPGERLQPLPELQVFAPDLPVACGDNDRSLWVRAEVLGLVVLLTGDAQEAGTAAALQSGFASRCDVLVLPHHGRQNANAMQLLAATRPRVGLASASSGDGDTAFGSLVRRIGAELWVTGQHGTVTVSGHPPTVQGTTPRGLPRRGR